MSLIHALEPYHPWFYEEIAQALNVDVMAEMARKTHVPIATGERIFTKWGFREILEKRAATILQPDVCYAGGITELKIIAGMAEAYYTPLAPHNPQGPVSTAASIEFGFSQPSYIICESVHADVPWRADIVEEGFTVDQQTRTVTPNTKPGLGISINEEAVRQHPFQQEVLQRVFYRDGAVGDW